MDELVLGLLAKDPKDPKDRPESAGAVAKALGELDLAPASDGREPPTGRAPGHRTARPDPRRRGARTGPRCGVPLERSSCCEDGTSCWRSSYRAARAAPGVRGTGP
ncbi:serine/threonine-protein kinase [Streptomyces erythrochromogenes]|uniref:hypothetical protein n=1 Tax=Streptomyces erythrochromogenes TaxID=285574 RepID=UPI0038064107